MMEVIPICIIQHISNLPAMAFCFAFELAILDLQMKWFSFETTQT